MCEPTLLEDMKIILHGFGVFALIVVFAAVIAALFDTNNGRGGDFP